MIVKDEESNLATCLGSIADLVDEIVVVDTGSTDRTREVAIGFGARVHDFAWVDDFSAARNESLRLATGRWIIWLDGDEWLGEEDRGRLKSLFSRLGDENAGYIMQQFCLDQSRLDGVAEGVDRVVEQVRLFRNHPEIRWHHRVYEQIVGGVRRTGGDLRRTDVVIQHPGYQNVAIHRRKIERNLRLARLENRDDPDNPYVLYTLGVFHQMLGNPADSVLNLRRSLGRMWLGASYGQKLYALLAQSLHRSGLPHEALAICRAGRDRYPDEGEMRIQEAILRRDAIDAAGAETFLSQLLQAPRGRYPADVERDLRKHARHNLAMIYRQQRRASDAELHWREALVESPDFALGWLELGELYLSLGQWAGLDHVLGHLEVNLGRIEDALVLRARGHMARREYPTARQLLEKAISLAPRSLRPRQALSHILLFEGRDSAAAEQALHEVLELDPGNEQALQNLAILRRKALTDAPRMDVRHPTSS